MKSGGKPRTQFEINPPYNIVGDDKNSDREKN